MRRVRADANLADVPVILLTAQNFDLYEYKEQLSDYGIAQILTKPFSPRELLTTVNQMNSDRYVGDAKMHDMVAVAMEENWDVCKTHMEFIIGAVAAVIADGVAAGEFDAHDVGLAAGCVCTAMVRFFNPQLIAQCVDKPGPTLDQMIDFVVAGLSR